MCGIGVLASSVVWGSRGGCSFGALVRALWGLWRLGGVWMEMGDVYGRGCGSVHVRVVYGMVMDETMHVFPGGGVGELVC